MRLGQLSRQLSITPEELVTYLTSQGIPIENQPNARVDDAHVELVLQRFVQDNETLRQQVREQLPEAAEPPEPTPSEDSAPTETIRAPKVELQGLRVVGKIDLPEKKKPEAAEVPEPPKPTAPLQRNPRPDRYRDQPRRDRKNPVALAREQEERERKRKEEEIRAIEKERKAEYYRKRLKPQAPTKRVRLIDEEVEEMPALEPERPKTLWGRFKKWLNT